MSDFYYYGYGTGVAKMDCALTSNCADDFCSAFGVGGVPTGRWFALNCCGEDGCPEECIEGRDEVWALVWEMFGVSVLV